MTPETGTAAVAPECPKRGTIVSTVRCAVDTTPLDLDVCDVVKMIRTGGKKLRGQITQIRNRFEAELDITGDLQAAKLAVAELKRDLPAVTWSGRFSYRASESLVQHSGLLCADLDSLGPKLDTVREKLKTSCHLSSLFLSPTGNGLKPVFRVPADASKHSGSFRAVEKHIRDLTGIQLDESCKDVARLCFMSFDPEVYHNPDATELEPLPEPEKPKSAFNSSGEVNLSERQRIATEMFGDIEWDSDTHGFLTCPGKHLHTTGEKEQDCEIHLDGAPNIHCFHGHCKGIEAGVNHELQSRIGKAEFVATPQIIPKSEKAVEPDIPKNAEDETITRLAALSPIEYDRIRKDEAKKLKCREATLDSLVRATRLLMRPPGDNDNLQGVAVSLIDAEPWPEPVSGGEVLGLIAQRFDNYVVLPPGAADMLSLWCAHTHVVKLFQISPRLNISAPTEECGKTTLRNCVSLFCARAVRTDNMTTAVMFRLVSGHSPTILADECDKWLFINEELVGLVCSGHEKGGAVMRCEGESNELRKFGCYAPFVLAAIGVLPSQLHSRSICVRLERARREEIKKRSRLDFEHVEHETELNRKLARWITDNRERICSCKPRLPEHLFNRISDNWRPLFAIAEAAGGDWPRRCAAALANLTTREDERENLRVMLLADIREVFKGERMFTRDLVEALVELKERPWPEIQKGKPITARWLARNLAVFGIQPGNIWDGENQAQAKGYERSQFDDAFDRYIPETQEGGISSVQPSNTEVKLANSSVQKEEVWTDAKEPIHEAIGRLDGSKGGKPGKGDKVI